MSEPMERVQTRIVWQDKAWRLRVDRLRLPNGRQVEQGFIEHPGAVVLVPLRMVGNEPEVLMLRQYRPALEATALELPAGTRGWDEDWLVCAQRELREETGFRARSFTPLGQIWPAPGVSNELMALYLATDLEADPLPHDADELLEVDPMLLRELVTLARDGGIQDAKSVVAILRAAHYLQMT